MIGLTRFFYRVAAAFAKWRAKDAVNESARWLARADRWAKRAAGDKAS